ncbi:MAG TPA: S53 family peptidase [Polyangiaceae bacterium]|nr:S53 family peptidase [Polyangiaceae bacterium]
MRKAIMVSLVLAGCGGATGDSTGSPVSNRQTSNEDLISGLGGVVSGVTNTLLGVLTTTQNLLPGLANASDQGPAATATALRFVVTMKRPNVAAEQALLDSEHNPASPDYRHFLTPSEFAARFGVPQAQVDQATGWLAGGGLTVEHVSAARDQISVRGDVAHVDALLKTATHRFSYAGDTFLANTAAPSVPSGLGISNVVGLNTLQKAATPSKPAQTLCISGVSCLGNTTPKDLWSVYEQPDAYQGQGQKIAIFGEGQTDDVIADLRVFEQQNGLPEMPVTVVHPAGDTDFSDDSGSEEWNIDTQASSGMAPKADGMVLYFGQDLSDADVSRIFSTFTDDANGPLQASASFGECETIPGVSPLVGGLTILNGLPIGIGLGNNMDATLSEIVRQAALEGKTIFVSTGDTGSSCPVVVLPIIGAGNGLLNQVVPVTNSPASLPYVVGVGGTVLYTDGSGNRSREYGWAFSGGGSTLFTPAPSYQVGTPALIPCVTDLTKPCRGISDVAAQSGDVLTNGYGIIAKGAATTGGGTSLSSPLWEGMWVRVQGAAASSSGNGFANYALYRVGNDPASYARDFFDVSSLDLTHGLPAVNGIYATTPGWDYVTGFGTPRVAGLICDIAGQGCAP